MAYKPNPRGPVSDKTYASQIADERPMLATRIHCEEPLEEEETIHEGGSQVDRFHEALNSGRGIRRGSR
jgi:hypothetical protein